MYARFNDKMINLDMVEEIVTECEELRFWNNTRFYCSFKFDSDEMAVEALELICDGLVRGENLIELTQLSKETKDQFDE